MFDAASIAELKSKIEAEAQAGASPETQRFNNRALRLRLCWQAAGLLPPEDWAGWTRLHFQLWHAEYETADLLHMLDSARGMAQGNRRKSGSPQACIHYARMAASIRAELLRRGEAVARPAKARRSRKA